MPRKILDKIKIDEISAVDVPAQEGARMAIMKRGQPIEKGKALAAFLNRAIDAKADDDDGRSEVIESMATAAGISASTVRQILRAEIDIPPESRLRGFARALGASASTLIDLAGGTEKRAEALAKSSALTTSIDGHSHLISDQSFDGSAVNAGETSYSTTDGGETGHSHPWIRLDDGSIRIGESGGHSHEIAAFAAKRASTGEPDMPKSIQDQLTDALAKIGDLETTATAAKEASDEALAKARHDRIKAGMSAAEQKRFDALDDDGKKTFLAGSKKKRGEAMAKWSESDPVVYKAANGTEYRASQGELAEIVKQADTDREEMRLAKAEAADAKIEKRISVDFPALPNPKAAGALLKAVGRIEDDTLRGEAETLLKTANAAIAGLAVNSGTGGDGGESQIAKTAATTFNGKVAEIRKRDDCSNQAAMSKARIEHPDLFKAMNEVAEAA